MWLAIAGLLSCFSPIARADAPPLQDALLDHLVGSWVLRGQIAGEATTHAVSAGWVAGHQYVEILERSREQADDGRPAYEAVVLIGWNAADAHYQCLWLDSTGGGAITAQSIGRGRKQGDAIEFAWSSGDVVTLTNTFTYEAQVDAWTWRIDNVIDGRRSVFGEVRLTRE